MPHTRALCFTTLDRYGQPALAPWVPIARDLRAQLVVASVATPLVRP